METLIDTSLKNSALVLAIVTLLYVAIAELKMTERIRIMLVYIFAGFLAFAGSLQLRYICVGALVVPLLVLEFLTVDVKRQQLFTRPDYKILDFSYRMFAEYAYGYFILAMIATFTAHRWHDITLVHIIASLAALILVMLALLSVAAQKYATKPITKIVEQLEHSGLTYEMETTPHILVMLNILVRMEDQSYFARSNHQHTLSFLHLLTKGLERLRSGKFTQLIQALRDLFSRGYGTIEMQLLRSIGIDYGYQYTVRRKLFEILYANMLFNGYRAYLVRERGDYSQYRNFIILKYIENADVSINGNKYRPRNGVSSLLQMFHKTDIAHITKEEFFIWCLGLPQYPHIYPGVLHYYNQLMDSFGINRQEVEDYLGISR